MIKTKLHCSKWPTGCACMLSLLFISASLSAAQPDGLRLFHEPEQSDIVELKASSSDKPPAVPPSEQGSSGSLNKQSKKQPAIVEKPAAESTLNGIAYNEFRDVYKYNGFISTRTGRHYLINGLRLKSFDALELVSIGNGGQSLVLKSTKGRVFELSIGQSIGKDSL